MEITRHPAGALLTLVLTGRLDGTWSEHTSQALANTLEEGWHHLELDLSGVSFLSSAGIRTLLVHHKRLAALQGSFTVINPSTAVRETLEMAGLHQLLAARPASIPASGIASPVHRSVTFEGGALESFPLTPSGRLRAALLSSAAPHTFPAGTLGLGLGTLGNAPGLHGEFLALGGAALAQPTDGKESVDYILTQGQLLPTLTPHSGIAAHGAFSQLLRFESEQAHVGIPLSALLALALKESAAPAVGIAFAVETQSLVGAALLQAPTESAPLLKDYPDLRDQLLFTAEPAWPHSLTLGVAFATREAGTPISGQLRPLPSCPSSGEATGSPLFAHTHAVAFPYRPLPKGQLSLEETCENLLNSERPLGLLHLLCDTRPGGLGESRFLRGALWIAPLDF